MKTKIFSAFAGGIIACFFFTQFAWPYLLDSYRKRSAPVVENMIQLDPLAAFIPDSVYPELVTQAIDTLVIRAARKPGWRKTGKAGFDMRVSDDTLKLAIKNPAREELFFDIGAVGFCTGPDNSADSQKRYYAAVLYAIDQLERCN